LSSQIGLLTGSFFTPWLAERNASLGLSLDVAVTYSYRTAFVLVFIGFLGHLFVSDASKSAGRKAAWGLLLLFLNMFAFPFYWYFQISGSSGGDANAPA
jgi:hypothetical protein